MYKLYNVVNLEESGISASPFVWRTLMALKHKGLQFELVNLRLCQVSKVVSELTNGQWQRVPVLVKPDGNYIYDSPNIANYLEEVHPEKPLFPNGKYFSTFLEKSIENLSMFRAIILDIYKLFSLPDDATYFKQSREAAFKMSLEQFSGNKEDTYPQIEAFFNPFRASLKKFKFLEGDQVTYSDYILFGSLKSLSLLSQEVFDHFIANHSDQSLKDWFNSMQHLHNDFALNFKAN